MFNPNQTEGPHIIRTNGPKKCKDLNSMQLAGKAHYVGWTSLVFDLSVVRIIRLWTWSERWRDICFWVGFRLYMMLIFVIVNHFFMCLFHHWVILSFYTLRACNQDHQSLITISSIKYLNFKIFSTLKLYT